MKDSGVNANGAFLSAGVVLVGAALAYGQLGERVNRASNFSTPSTTFGLGGPYTNTALSSAPFTFTPSNEVAPLAVAPRSWQRYRGDPDASEGRGIRAYGTSQSLLSLPPPVSMRPMATPLAEPWAAPLAVPLTSSVPQYDPVHIPALTRIFDPTVKPDSFARPTARGPTRLGDVAPSGPSAAAIQPNEKPPQIDQVLPGLEALREFSQRRETKLSDEGAESLQRAMQALKEGRFRGDRTQPGAVDLFRRARLLAGEQPEPMLGLIACLVSTADYNQAAVLVGPLVRKWPEVLGKTDFAEEYYARPEQIRAHLLALREAVAARGDANLRLLWAFYRWYGENKRQAVAEVDRLALAMGPESDAAAMLEAMRIAAASGG
jgi:hypothetical protein